VRVGLLTERSQVAEELQRHAQVLGLDLKVAARPDKWPMEPPIRVALIDLRTGSEGDLLVNFGRSIKRVIPAVALIEESRIKSAWERCAETLWLVDVLPLNPKLTHLAQALTYGTGDPDDDVGERWRSAWLGQWENNPVEPPPTKGRLSDHPLARVLLGMACGGASGALALKLDGGGVAYLYLEDGQLLDLQADGDAGWRLPALFDEVGLRSPPPVERAAVESVEAQIGVLLGRGAVDFGRATELLQRERAAVLASLLDEQGAYVLHEKVLRPGPPMAPSRMVDALAAAVRGSRHEPGLNERILIQVLGFGFADGWDMRPRERRALNQMQYPILPIPTVRERLTELGGGDTAALEVRGFLGVLAAAQLLMRLEDSLPATERRAMAELNRRLARIDLGGTTALDVLELGPGASLQDAEAAFRSLSLAHHADRYHRAHPRLQKVAGSFGLHLNAAISQIRRGEGDRPYTLRESTSGVRRPPRDVGDSQPAQAPPKVARPQATRVSPRRGQVPEGKLTKEMARPLFVSAQRWIRHRSYGQALEILDKAHQADPEDAEIEIQWQWVRFLNDRGHADAAQERLKVLAKEAPEHTQAALLAMVRILRLSGKLTEASNMVGRALRVAPGSRDLEREERLLEQALAEQDPKGGRRFRFGRS
jgi:tetratricopeptide (TPR) repeat protein